MAVGTSTEQGVYKGKVEIHIAEPQSNKCKQEQKNTFKKKGKIKCKE